MYKKEDSWTLDHCGKKVSCTCSYVQYPRQEGELPVVLSCLRLLGVLVGWHLFKHGCNKEALLNRPHIASLCEVWRSRSIPSDRLGDVYDGHMWQLFSMIVQVVLFLLGL